MEQSYFVITKTVPGTVIFDLSPITNTEQHRIIKLTEKMPSTRLPKDWALGVFLKTEVFDMYKKGIFTFDNPEEVTKLAVQEQVYFGDELDFKPRSKDYVNNILTVLKQAQRNAIIEAIKEDRDVVLAVAQEHINELTNGTISLLEKETGKQIRIEEE